MSENKAKWIRVGKVIKKVKGGVCVVVGDPENKNDQYRYNVELKVTDASGKVIATAKSLQGKPLFLNVSDPRKRPGIKEEDAAKIPASLVSELFFVENNE